MKDIFKRILAAFLVIMLLGANLAMVGIYFVSYALTNDELAAQTTATQSENVEFNMYVEGGNYTASFDVQEEGVIYANIKVLNNGYLKNAKITLKDSNLEIITEGLDNVNIQSSTEKQIELKQLNAGTNITIEIPVKVSKSDNVSLDYFEKEISGLFTAIYIDNNGDENNISKEIINRISIYSEVQANLNAELISFVPYSIEENNGIMVQVKVNTKIEDSMLPIKYTNITLTSPVINNTYASSVNVIANNTLATNGKNDGVDFNIQNYSYEKGSVEINTTNNTDSISWISNKEDEYIVTFIYEGLSIEEYKLDTVTNVVANIEAYSSKNSSLEVKEIIELKTEAIMGNISDMDINTSNINKGQIYANYNSSEKQETTYEIEYVATIFNKEITKNIEIKQLEDVFVNEEGKTYKTTLSGKNYTYNKEVSIDEKIFEKILGQEGYIEVYSIDNVLLGRIDSELVDEEENRLFTIDISEFNVNELIIKTSEPIENGKLNIVIQKAIKTNLDYSKVEVQSFETLNTKIESNISDLEINVENKIKLNEPTSVAEVSTNKEELTTVVVNEDVEIRVTLDTSSNTNALFSNPTFKITLPSYISKIDIKSSDIVMNNGLEIEKVETKKENGTYVIYIELDGTQKSYTTDAIYKGSIVTLNTDLTVNALTPSNENEITMEYTNENELEEKVMTIKTDLNFVAPNGVVAANSVSNYALNTSAIVSIADESVVATIDTYSAAIVSTITGKIVNNYENSIENIVVLGLIPSEDSTTESTFNTKLVSELIFSENVKEDDVTVYYSENANATKDLNNSANLWSTEYNENTKAYLIVLNSEYELEDGESIEFAYNVEIPENLTVNNDSAQMYTVYYDNVSYIGTISETEISPMIMLTTGAGPELEVTLSTDETTFKEGQVVKMNVTVENIGEVDATNVKINATSTDYSSVVSYGGLSKFYTLSSGTQTISIGTVKVGEKVESFYYIKLTSLSENISNYPKTVSNTVNVVLDDISGSIFSNTLELSMEKGDVSVNVLSSFDNLHVLNQGREVRLVINIENIKDNTFMENGILKIKLDDGMKFLYAQKTVSTINPTYYEDLIYDEINNIVSIKLNEEVVVSDIMYVMLEVSNGYSGNTNIQCEVTADNYISGISNILSFEIDKVNLVVSEMISNPLFVKEMEYVTYNFEVYNDSASYVKNVEIINKLPDELEFSKLIYTYKDEEHTKTINTDNTASISISTMNAYSTINVTIVARARLIPTTTPVTVENQVIITAMDGEKEYKTNIVQNVIEYNQEYRNQLNQNGSTDTESNLGPYKISGTTWIDENKNGEREVGEALLSNVKAILYDNLTNEVVMDKDTDLPKEFEIEENGKYEFNNLEKGNYYVIFVYDTARYNLTTYKAEGVDDALNSDVININVEFDEERTMVATSDKLIITNSNIENVNMGVYSSENFDLRLDKYITKLVVTTTAGTSTYSYDNAKIAKVEVSRSNLGVSSVAIEYTIVVTNEGAVDGYVKKIVDYLPEGVSFTTDINTDWYLSDNGNVYNASLANEVIKPGESKLVTLVVTQKVSQDTLGILNNNAEIYESYNEEGLKDIDSTEGNQDSKEDDMSEANVVLSLNTGKILMYVTIIFGVISLLGFGVYEINKKVLIKRKGE